MVEKITVDMCVIGAGAAGLSVAAGASQLGASTALIENGRMGGDCLNYGCVPSKSLLAAGRASRAGDRAAAFEGVRDRVHAAIAAIAPHDSVARFEALGVRVINDTARFTGPAEIAAGDVAISARRFVIATGSVPAIPPIPGLDTVPYLTNETIFDVGALPDHLVIIGGGPIGMELGQAFRHLGARVSVVEQASVLSRDDPELVDILATRLRRDGVDILEGTRVASVEGSDGTIAVTVEGPQGTTRLDASHLLVAAGRQPSIAALDLARAGVAHGPGGITVDAGLRTTNRRVYAIGDAVGGPQLTHRAAHHAAIVIHNALFRLPAKATGRAMPWVTYTDPELAHVGLFEAEARARHGRIRVLRWPFADNDRAVCERDATGLVKAITTARGRILGASIVGPHAGELILPWVLAVDRKLRVGALAAVTVPYPTYSEATKRVAASFFAPALFSERTRRVVRALRHLG